MLITVHIADAWDRDYPPHKSEIVSFDPIPPNLGEIDRGNHASDRTRTIAVPDGCTLWASDWGERLLSLPNDDLGYTAAEVVAGAIQAAVLVSSFDAGETP